MPLSNDSIGFLIWGISCAFAACFLLIYDGFIKRNLNIICKLYCSYLISHVIASVLIIINIEYAHSDILQYIFFVLLSFGANICVIVASIWILIPLNRYKLFKMLICYILPIIYLIFLIALNFIPPIYRKMAVFLYYLPAGLYLYISLFILYYWFKTRRFAFTVFGESKPYWNLLFVFALIASTLSLINLIYPTFAEYHIVPSQHSVLWILCIDAFICIPLIIPLFRNLDKIEQFYHWRTIEHNDNADHDDDAFNTISWEEIFDRNMIILKKQWGWIIFGVALTIWHNLATNIAYMMHTQNDTLWDVGHSLLPENDSMQSTVEVIFWIGFVVGLLFMLIPSFMKHPTVLTLLILIRYLKVSGFVIILRTISYLSTSLPAPDDNCRVESNNYDPPSSWKEIFEFNNVSDACGDLIFSGHISLTLTMAICISHYYYYLLPKLLWKFIAFGIQLPLVLLLAIIILIARTHYTVDIFIAIYTVPLLYHFVWYILPDPNIQKLQQQNMYCQQSMIEEEEEEE